MSPPAPSQDDPHVDYDPEADTLTVCTWPGGVATRVAEGPAPPWALTLRDRDGGSLGFGMQQADWTLPTVVVSLDRSLPSFP